MAKIDLTAERLREIFNYDPSTGTFARLTTTTNAVKVGSKVGNTNKLGYSVVSVDNRKYLGHRLVWLHVYGVWPDQEIDHINGIRDDNRLENLRAASSAENKQNVQVSKNNTTGYLGVRFRKDTKRWTAEIWKDRKKHTLGCFGSAELAYAAYLKAKESLHKFCPSVRIDDVVRYPS